MPVMFGLVLCLYSSVRCVDGTITQPNDPSLLHLDGDRYVDQKFERIERLLLQKDDRISELEDKLASHMTVYTNYVTNNAIEMEFMNSALAQLQQDVTQKDQLLQELQRRVVGLETVDSNRDDPRERLPQSTDDDVIPKHKTNVEPLIATLHEPELIDATPRVSGKVMNGGFEPNNMTNLDTVVRSRSVVKSDSTYKMDDNGGVNVMSVVENDDVIIKSIPNEALRSDEEQGVDNRGSGRKRVAPNPVSNVAFHAEMTVTGTVIKGSTLVYNHEVLDHGDGYSTSDGLYLVPNSGTYVITWTTVTNHDYVQTLLIVNGATRGSSMTDSQEVTDVHQTTMIVVLTLNQGDHVSIRVGTLGHGTIHTSDVYSKPTFSGWKLYGTQ